METLTIQVPDLAEVSDGYHTIQELYDHRNALFVNFCLTDPENCAWKFDEKYEGWLILYYETVWGQISYHIEEEKFYSTLCHSDIKRDPNYKWDGHTPTGVLARLLANM